MKLKLELDKHLVDKDNNVINVLNENNILIAAIYPTEKGVKIVSKYINNHKDLVYIDLKEPPAIVINIL